MRHMRRAWFGYVLMAICSLGMADYWLHADEPTEKPAAGEAKPERRSSLRERKRKAKEAEDAAKRAIPVDPSIPLEKPANWPKDHPLPQVASNCARCHLTAGRELTTAVVDFAHSVHDLNEMSCVDCHGGNTKDNVEAHEQEFGFIGTKLSAHLAKCAECHQEQADVLAGGPHHWDFSTRINTRYPMCIDCHGNHDVGNPPGDFTLAQVCEDCHRDLNGEFPQLASVVHANDRLWQTIQQIREEKLGQTTERVPKELQPQVDALRHETMQVMHQSKELSAAEAKGLCERTDAVQKELQNWLKGAAGRP